MSPYLGPVEHVLHGQHRDDGQDFVAASEMDGHDQHLTQHGLEREFGHLNEKSESEKIAN